MNNNITIQGAASLLRERDNILILTHCRPDGDTIGCASGLCAALRGAGKTAYLLYNPEITEVNGVYAQPYWAPEGFAPDFVVSVDVASRERFFPAADAYFDRIGLAIDHHPSFEDFGEAHYADPDAAACGEIVYEVCRELGEVTQEAALPLYAAVSTDTGCFAYANTTANSHRVAAALMATGIDYFAVNKRHFRTKSRRRIAIEAALLGGMEFFDEGRGVFLTVPQSLMQSVGATENDMEDISSLAGIVEGVDCGVVLRENKEGKWRVSLRTGANGRVNATEACQVLGGGGHAMAAGATVSGTLEEVRARTLAAIDQVKKF